MSQAASAPLGLGRRRRRSLPLPKIDVRRVWRSVSTQTGGFLGLCLFTLVLYLRPNDLFPAIGEFPVAKVAGVLALLLFFGEQLAAGRVTIMPDEMRYFL